MLSQTDDDDKSIASIDGDSTYAIEQKQRKILDILSNESKRKTSTSIKGYVFGPFIVVNKEAQMCTRCGLFVPSAQTGETIVSYFHCNHIRIQLSKAFLTTSFPLHPKFLVYKNQLV